MPQCDLVLIQLPSQCYYLFICLLLGLPKVACSSCFPVSWTIKESCKKAVPEPRGQLKLPKATINKRCNFTRSLGDCCCWHQYILETSEGNAHPPVHVLNEQQGLLWALPSLKGSLAVSHRTTLRLWSESCLHWPAPQYSLFWLSLIFYNIYQVYGGSKCTEKALKSWGYCEIFGLLNSKPLSVQFCLLCSFI